MQSLYQRGSSLTIFLRSQSTFDVKRQELLDSFNPILLSQERKAKEAKKDAKDAKGKKKK